MGTAAGRDAARSFTMPRLVGGVAVIALAVLVVVQLAKSGGSTTATAPTMPPTAGTAPDITSLSPRERASRLYDRIMRLNEEQKRDSVTFFAPMALASYADIPDMDADARYDMARVAILAGALPVARAQADTILRSDASHLLGLLLAADIARARHDPATAAKMEAAFVAAAPRERARKLAEYEAHGPEIETAMSRLAGSVKR